MSNDKKLEELKLKANKEQCQKLIDLVERNMDFKRWGFQQTFVDIPIETPPSVIYDSEWCRVKIISRGWDMYTGDSVQIDYGRLHAPSDSNVMIWNGKICFCWHRVNEALNYLDGLPPQEAIDQLYVDDQWPHVMEEFRQSELGKSLSHHQAEWITKMHAAIWDYYGQHLFELFDLRRPDLWKQYTLFIREFYRIKGLNPNSTPAQDKIC